MNEEMALTNISNQEPEIVVGDKVYYLPEEDGTISCFARWKFDLEALEAPEPIVQGYDGKYYFESQCPETPASTREEVRVARARLYTIDVDPLMSEYNRKKTFGVFEEGEETELLAKIEAKVAEIKENNPYPEQLEKQVEEVIEDGVQGEEKEIVLKIR